LRAGVAVYLDSRVIAVVDEEFADESVDQGCAARDIAGIAAFESLEEKLNLIKRNLDIFLN